MKRVVIGRGEIAVLTITPTTIHVWVCGVDDDDIVDATIDLQRDDDGSTKNPAR